MSPTEKIAKLESLLARVKERAEAPRATGAVAFQPPPAHVAESAHAVPEPAPAVHQSPTAPPPSVEAVAAAHMSSVPPPPETATGWTEPPPETSAEPVLETGEADIDADMEVEVSAEVVEVDIDIDEPGLLPAESGTQPVAEHATNGFHPAEVELYAAANELMAEPSVPPPADELMAEPSVPPPVDELMAEPSVPPPPPEPPAANEVLEPAPSSSPRPIASEKPEAYEEESAPRHTPPPESGKQVAAPSSSPPPSLEGHTLIGGWREPGMALPREPGADLPRAPAVRVPPPPPPPPREVFGSAPPAPPAPLAPPQRLVAEVTQPQLRADAPVATIEGAAPRFTPASFGDLLDATLSL